MTEPTKGFTDRVLAALGLPAVAADAAAPAAAAPMFDDDGDEVDAEGAKVPNGKKKPADDGNDGDDKGMAAANEGGPVASAVGVTDAGLASVVNTTVAACNTRWSTVLRSEPAATRMTAAIELLAETDLPADRVIGMLGKFGGDKPAGPSFSDRMDTEAANPAVTAHGGNPDANAPTVLTRMAARFPKKGA